MLFVCLSHFCAVYLTPWDEARFPPLLRRSGALAIFISMVATPAFITISAIVVGYVFTVSPGSRSALRRKLIDRGLFLIFVGHLLQAVPWLIQRHDFVQSVTYVFITDVIGVSIIIGPSLVIWMSPRARQYLGILLLVFSWATLALRDPSIHAESLILKYAFGHPDNGQTPGFPFIPWFGVYILATTLGERIGAAARQGNTLLVRKILLCVGLSAFLGGVLIRALVHVLRGIAPAAFAPASQLSRLLALEQKFPPGPVYMLFFGGAVMLIMELSFTLSRSDAWRPLTRPLAAIGRGSFFVFIIQAYLYYLILPVLELPHPRLWPLYYSVSVGVFLLAATLFNAVNGNRFLTVGLWRTWPLLRSFRTRIRTGLALR
jgi:hypothetical protein